MNYLLGYVSYYCDIPSKALVMIQSTKEAKHANAQFISFQHTTPLKTGDFTGQSWGKI